MQKFKVCAFAFSVCLSFAQANWPHFLLFLAAEGYRRNCASSDARFFILTLFYCLFHASLFIVQTIRPPFSFSSCRKRKRSPTAKRKRALSVDWAKGPFKRAFWPPHLPAGHHLKVFCAPADAQPLTLAVCAAWWCHCRFHIMQLHREKVEKLLKRLALPRRTARDSAMPPGLPGSAAERPERHKRPLDMKNLFLLYRVAAFFFS